MEIHIGQTQSQGSAPTSEVETPSTEVTPETPPEPVEETAASPEPEAEPVLETAALEPGGETAILATPAKKQRRPRSDRGKPRGPYKKRQAQPETTTSDQG